MDDEKTLIERINETRPPPSRFVPDKLLAAAKAVARLDNYGNNDRKFEQGRGPLCYGNAEYQAEELLRRARLHDALAEHYYRLSHWMSTQDGA